MNIPRFLIICCLGVTNSRDNTEGFFFLTKTVRYGRKLY